MNELEIDPGRSGRAELGRCLRRCDELEARLRHALEEQRRIRQGLQSRLLENQEAHRREVQLIGEKWAQEKRDLQSQWQASQSMLEDAESTITVLSQQLVERQADLKFLDDQINQVQHRLDSTLNELNGIYRSLSWRLTAPLRWLHRPFRRQGAQ
jgi:hypothetical protein